MPDANLLAYWRALYEESSEPPKPIPAHVVTVWDEDGTMQLIDLCCVLTEDNGSFCGRELPCPEHSDGSGGSDG